MHYQQADPIDAYTMNKRGELYDEVMSRWLCLTKFIETKVTLAARLLRSRILPLFSSKYFFGSFGHQPECTTSHQEGFVLAFRAHI